MLGTVKVMSYKDIDKAQAKHTTKDTLRGKGKCRRKYKSIALDEGKSRDE